MIHNVLNYLYYYTVIPGQVLDLEFPGVELCFVGQRGKVSPKKSLYERYEGGGGSLLIGVKCLCLVPHIGQTFFIETYLYLP